MTACTASHLGRCKNKENSVWSEAVSPRNPSPSARWPALLGSYLKCQRKHYWFFSLFCQVVNKPCFFVDFLSSSSLPLLSLGLLCSPPSFQSALCLSLCILPPSTTHPSVFLSSLPSVYFIPAFLLVSASSYKNFSFIQTQLVSDPWVYPGGSLWRYIEMAFCLATPALRLVETLCVFVAHMAVHS